MSDSESEMEKQYELQVYSLIRFIHRGRKRQIESIDIVPTKWLDFNKSKARCVTKFMAGPYNKEDLELIHNLVINNTDAPEDWPTFSIELVGRAMTYEEGLNKMKRLETEENVLTLDSEDSASEAQRQLTLAVKRRKLTDEANKYKDSFSVSSKTDKSLLVMKDVSNTPKAFQKRNCNNGVTISSDGGSCSTATIQLDSFQLPCSTEDVRSSTVNYEENITDDELMPMKKNSLVSNAPECGHRQDKQLSSNVRVEPPNPTVSPSSFKCTSSAEVSQNFSPFKENMICHAPIYYNNVECKTPFEVEVLLRLDQLSADVADMKQRIDSMTIAQAATTNFLTDKKVVARSVSNLEEKYQIQLPLTEYENFQSLEEKLKEDKFFKKDVYIELKSCADKDCNISKTILKMFKRFFVKDLANQFTAMRISSINKNKYIFKRTTLCAMMEGIIIKLRQEKSLSISSEEFNSSLSDVLSNVSKWK